MQYFPFILLLSFFLSKSICHGQISTNSGLLNNINSVELIAFGSCNKTQASQAYWEIISNHKPDLWIWMGDIIYADTENMDQMQDMYSIQKKDPYYSSFRAKHPILGIWDDHDYGTNDGNKTYPQKDEAKELLFDFLDIPKNDIARSRAGAYQSYDVGDKNRIKIILLDTRSFQDPLERDTVREQRYKPSDGDILGEEQWTWLENELANSLADLNIIVSSIQFLAKDHPFEKWENFPKAKSRFLNLMKDQSEQKVIFLSGDRHIAEISKLDIPELNYQVFDITSSGLTHSYEGADEYNELRCSTLIDKKNYGLLHIVSRNGLTRLRVQIMSVEDEVLIDMDLGTF